MTPLLSNHARNIAVSWSRRSVAFGAPSAGTPSGPRAAHAIAVVRSGRAIGDFDRDFVLRVGDVLVLTGTHREMQEALRRLDPEREPERAMPTPGAPGARTTR